MRVALFQDHLRNGGTENQTLHIAEGLSNAGLSAEVIVFRKGGALDQRASQGPYRLRFLNQGLLKSDWFAPGLAGHLRSSEVDAAIAMGRMANCHAGRLATSRREFKLVATIRTGKSIPWLQRKALQNADHIIANSRDAMSRLNTRYGINRPESASVIYNGCIRGTESEYSNCEWSPNGALELINVGMFRAEKNQRRLLHICSQLSPDIDWRLTFVGDGPEKEPCIALARQLGIANRVAFPGLVDDPTELYLASHIAVHASLKESLPNALIEAQMCGLPVVAYDVGGVEETFDSGTSGILVSCGNESGFKETLEKLCRSRDLRQRMSAAARQHARLNFSPQNQISAYVDMLARLVRS